MKHSTSVEKISPLQAAEWLKTNRANRPIRNYHVVFLADEMRAGRFMPTNTIHFVIENGEALLINGQHTLLAVVKSNVTLPAMPIMRTTECTLADQLNLYIQYDQGKHRTFSDSAQALDFVGQYKTNMTVINQIERAIRYIQQGFSSQTARHTKLPVAIMMELVPKWIDEGKALLQAIHGCDEDMKRCIYYRTAISSVALITLYYQRQKAMDFWRQVALDDGLSLGDPRKILHDFLPRAGFKRGIGRKGVPFDAQSRAAASMWNAFIEKRHVSRISMTQAMAKAPMKLLGTSYSGNQATEFLPYREDESSERVHA